MGVGSSFKALAQEVLFCEPTKGSRSRGRDRQHARRVRAPRNFRSRERIVCGKTFSDP